MRMAGLLGGKELRDATVSAFEADYNAYRALEALPNKSMAQKAFERRSVFHHASVRQHVEAFRSECACGCKMEANRAWGIHTWSPMASIAQVRQSALFLLEAFHTADIGFRLLWAILQGLVILDWASQLEGPAFHASLSGGSESHACSSREGP